MRRQGKTNRCTHSFTQAFVIWLSLFPLYLATMTNAQIVKPLSVQGGRTEQLLEMRWSDAPLQVVLDHYAELTGRTLIKSPGVPAVLISLRSQEKLTETEFLQAIEAMLAMNQIALVPLNDKFIKVVPIAEAGKNAKEIHFEKPADDDMSLDTDELERRVILLKHLTYTEVQPLIDELKHSYATIQPLERVNGFMIIDTKVNVSRITELIEFLDNPVEIKVETRIYELHHATASDVASRLNELIQQSQDNQRRSTTTRGHSNPSPGRGGTIRAGTATQRAAQAKAQAKEKTTTAQSQLDLAERGIIQGEVKIVSDERTNILIVISEPQNFAFFDKIVTILDKLVEPEIAVEVVALEYAEAEEISSILNEFIGAATRDQDSQRSQTPSGTVGQEAGNARATALRELISQRQAQRHTAQTQSVELPSGVGSLSSNTRILADDRTNSLLIMGRNNDIEILRGVIDELDIMLAQVMIEAILIEVNLDDDLDIGMDWLQRGYEVYNEESRGPAGQITVREPVVGFGGGQKFREADFIDGGTASQITPLSVGSLNYFATFYDLNIDMILRIAASSSDAKILSTPVVVTTDNTEATIIVGESRPVVTSTSTTSAGIGRNTFQYQDIALQLTVTPRINPQNFVVMEINQTADNVAGFEVIDGNNVPVITRREMEAQIAVENRSSIVLGGLIGSEKRKAQTKVPILGDIPLLGTLFRADSSQDNRTELMVIITPYVMTTPEEVRAEAGRLHQHSLASQNWGGETWSDSPLVKRPPETRENDAPKSLLGRLGDQLREKEAATPSGIFTPKADEQTSPPPEKAQPPDNELKPVTGPSTNGVGDAESPSTSP